MNSYLPGFEENDDLRSAFIRDMTLQMLDQSKTPSGGELSQSPSIPRTLIRYWHDLDNLPDDVRACIESWNRLADEGFEIQMFSDASAAAYIAERYGPQQVQAFARCRHPAMRSDYLRMCFVLSEGGFYVDADDVLLRGDSWKRLFQDGCLKVQPLCYDIPSDSMVQSTEIWQADLSTDGRIFYVNNNPIAAPRNHPVLQHALERATESLLSKDQPEIQSTTGPGNFTAALAAHARNLLATGAPLDFELLRDWGAIAETRWELSYRDDARNWRKMDAG